MIVIEDIEPASAQLFKVSVVGDKERIDADTPLDQLGPAEYWTVKVMSVFKQMVGATTVTDQDGRQTIQ